MVKGVEIYCPTTIHRCYTPTLASRISPIGFATTNGFDVPIAPVCHSVERAIGGGIDNDHI